MLSENKVMKIANECGMSYSCTFGHIKLSYRHIEVCDFCGNPDLESSIKWITTLGLAKRRNKFEHLEVPFIEARNISNHQAMGMLVINYVRPVYKKVKHNRHPAPICVTGGKARYIKESDFQADLDRMRAYIDYMLAMPKSGTGFANRLVMWHHRCRSMLSDMESVKRIDFNALEADIDKAAKDNDGIAKTTLYNGKTVYAKKIKDSKMIFYWETIFVLKLDDNIVLVRASPRSNIQIGEDGSRTIKEPYYEIKKITTLWNGIVAAIDKLNKHREEHNG